MQAFTAISIASITHAALALSGLPGPAAARAGRDQRLGVAGENPCIAHQL
jgi:hypothetical protein